MVTTEEKVHLTELIAGYSLASDNKDVEAHVAYYAEEGFIEGGMSTGPKNGSMAKDLEKIFEMEGTLKRHFAMNHLFKKVGEDIQVDYLLLVVEGEQMPGVVATAMIQDIFTRENDAWKIKRHSINIDPAMFNAMEQSE